jgi:hypothetical protein
MNEAPIKPFRIITALAVAVLALAMVFFIGPSVIHEAYRATTSAATIESRRAEYRRLDEGESVLSGADKAASQNARYKLFLWFHARGLNIDEGDEDYPLWHPWTELFVYWRG